MADYDDILPFSMLTDLELRTIISGDHTILYNSISYLDSLVFEPVVSQYDLHNNDIDVDSFMVNTRNVSLPPSRYEFLSDREHRHYQTQKTFSLLCFNIRSFSSNFQVFLDQCLFGERYDVMAFQETRLNNNIASLFHLPGYNFYTQCRNTEGGGVALYVSNTYNSSLLHNMCFTDNYLECVAVEVKCPNGIYLCASMYRPPRGEMPRFISKLNDLLMLVSEKNYRGIYLLGDWNVDLLKLESNPVVSQFLNLMYSFSYTPLITKPTRVTENCATLIDNIWSTEVEHNVTNSILYTDITDHFPITSYFSCSNNMTTQKILISKRIFSNSNTDNFVQMITNANWNYVYTENCANKAFNVFTDKFIELFDECFPLQNVCVTNKEKMCPYITSGLKASIKEKKRLERLSIKWPLSYREKYKIYRNKLTSLLRLAKNNYRKESLNNNQGNAKATWKILNGILGKQSHNQSNFIDIDCDATTIPDTFNSHFLAAGGPSEAARAAPRGAHRQYLTTAPNISLYLAPTTQQEVKTILDNLKCNAAGIDDIPPKLLKITSNIIANPLSYLINLAFTQGVFPDNLKIAKVIPVYKKGDKKDVNNYRQVSVLPAFSKVYEKAVSCRLASFLDNNNLLTDYQHGFRQNRSTETALIQFTSHLYNYLDTKFHVAGVFLDLSRAFDSLDHQILLDKLNNVGIRGVPLQLFKNYLSNRVQTVFCNSKFSSFGTIKQGVPQGSILGPILFLIYINDLVNVSENCKYVIFADDTTLLFADKNILMLHNILKHELGLVKQWITHNKLNLNLNKTNLIFFKNRSDTSEFPPVIVEDKTIQQVPHTKFLGVFVDEHLNWKTQIRSVCTKLSKASGILYRVRNQLTQKALLSVYFTLCYPHIIYCVSVWGCTWPSFIKDVIVAQKRVIRIMCSRGKYDHTADLYSDLHLLDFPSIHKYFLLLAIYKSLYTQVSRSSRNVFLRTAHAHSTRGALTNLVCPPARTTLYLNSILCAGPRLWNSLPPQIKAMTTLYSFKKNVKVFLFSLQ